LVQRLADVLGRLGKTYEVVLVDDGSPDQTWTVLEELHAADPQHVVAVQLMRNYGQHNAIMCGFRQSRGKYIITMDDDLQNPPEEIPKLVETIERGDLDLVYGVYVSKQHGNWRNFGSSLIQAFYRFVFKSTVPVSAFRVLRRPLLESIFSYNLNFTFVDGLLAWNTRRIGQVVVEHCARATGRSGYSLSRLLVHAMNILTTFSLLPLQMISLVGILAALGGVGAGAYYLIMHMFSKIVVPGYASTIVAVLVLGGLQLVALGIHGEYLGRLYLNVSHKPQYSERQCLRGPCPIEDTAAPSRANNSATHQDPLPPPR
jgi:undecaprenyl-phosphate 4-deoxy-4-formamido-L-arabinose transferase